MNAICVSCDCNSDDMPEEYTDEDPVEADGTFADGKFVCTTCYCYLIDGGRDVGSPQELQKAAIELVRPLNGLP